MNACGRGGINELPGSLAPTMDDRCTDQGASGGALFVLVVYASLRGGRDSYISQSVLRLLQEDFIILATVEHAHDGHRLGSLAHDIGNHRIATIVGDSQSRK